jgi:hypothetical protein
VFLHFYYSFFLGSSNCIIYFVVEINSSTLTTNPTLTFCNACIYGPLDGDDDADDDGGTINGTLPSNHTIPRLVEPIPPPPDENESDTTTTGKGMIGEALRLPFVMFGDRQAAYMYR